MWKNPSFVLVFFPFWVHVMLGAPKLAIAKDYILTMAGGYEPKGNQASLEANVLFFQHVLVERHPSAMEHAIYFADGFDAGADVQIMRPRDHEGSAAIELLEHVFYFDREPYDYRNHRVPDIQGPIQPAAMESGLDRILTLLTPKDRLLIYVTAHGSSAKGDNAMNTSITCWRRRPLSMTTFSQWLDRVPSSVPVIMVMAQCYCGGFSNSIFSGGDAAQGMAEGSRVGFFAQRHDLPAAGCRPDIENDEEYSSYFWGAILGKTRTGRSVGETDLNGDGRVSFGEAHAFATHASKTIDIPLCTSDAFLRQYSQIASYGDVTYASDAPENSSPLDPAVKAMSGTLGDFCSRASLEQKSIIQGLAAQLQLPIETDIYEVFVRSNEQHEAYRQSRRGRRGPRSSGRRDLSREILERWPELEDPQRWAELDWLRGADSDAFLEAVRGLPHYAQYAQSRIDRDAAREKSTNTELRDVLFRRLIHTLESIVLQENLATVASAELVQRFQSIRLQEGASLNSSP